MVFSYTLPATGWVRDFHPLERALTGRTIKMSAELAAYALRSADIILFGFHKLFVNCKCKLDTLVEW